MRGGVLNGQAKAKAVARGGKRAGKVVVASVASPDAVQGRAAHANPQAQLFSELARFAGTKVWRTHWSAMVRVGPRKPKLTVAHGGRVGA
jgi:hypothetical protein